MTDFEARIRLLEDEKSIRDLVLLYCRASDRKDLDLLRTLYTKDGTDTHGKIFDGPASEFIDFLGTSFPISGSAAITSVTT